MISNSISQSLVKMILLFWVESCQRERLQPVL